MSHLPLRMSPPPNGDSQGHSNQQELTSFPMLERTERANAVAQNASGAAFNPPSGLSLLRAPNSPHHNLPIQLSSFIGREREKSEVKQVLATTRLLTLTGAGGCGKTRLAIQVAADVLEEYADGVWLIELAALQDAALVPQAIASALGIREQPGYSLTGLLLQYLQSRELLLVLDNCEHLLGSCSQLCDTLLRRCPNLRILATSREALGITGEATWLVPSLSLPSTRADSLGALQQYEALQLFVDRAATILPGFTLTNENAALVAQICQRLDGIPLAIELAAARVKVLSVEQIAARLLDCFRLLTVGSRTALPRHQTLQAAMDWSYGLLSVQEQMLFRRLAVFAGSFTLEAVEAICTGDGLEEAVVLDLLSHLIDKSLVLVERRAPQGSQQAWYRLLGTIRQYGEARLQESGEATLVHNRHRDWYLNLAETAEEELLGPAQGAWLKQLEREHDNLRAALEWSKSRQHDVEAELRLAGALARFWYLQGFWSEGRSWLEHALAQSEALGRTAARAKALSGAGGLVWLHGESATARAQLEESAAIRRELGDRRGLAFVLALLGLAALYHNDPTGARARLEESVAMSRELDDTWDLAFALNSLGHVPHAQGDYAAARALCEESVALWRVVGDKWGLALSLHDLGWVALSQGDYARAAAYSEESLALSREQGNKEGIAWALHNLGYVALYQGDDEQAAACLQESLALFHELGNKLRIAMCLAGLAGVAGQYRQLVRVARLCGAVEALLSAISAPLPSVERSIFERTMAAARNQLDAAAFAAAYAEGRAMTLEQATAFALATNQERPTHPEGTRDQRPTTTDAQLPSSGYRPSSSEAHMAPDLALRIFALGPAGVYRGEHAFTAADWTYAKAKEMLCYLLCHRSATKEQIGLALWPDASTTQLRNNFRVTLYHLRRALGQSDWIRFEDNHYSFNRTLPYWFDVAVFESNLRQARQLQATSPMQAITYLEQAVKLYGGDFLADLVMSDWHLLRQEELRRLYLEALLTLGQLNFAEGHYRAAADAYRQVIAIDSYVEAAHRELMRCYARLGEHGQALRHYQTLREQLREELDTPPDLETTALFERLCRGDDI